MATIDRWNPEVIDKILEKSGEQILKVVATAVEARVVRNLSMAWPPPSIEGEFPHARTGALRRSIFWDIQYESINGKLVPYARVGSPLEYALYLEMGTPHMAPRSYLRRTLYEMTNELAILGISL